MSTGPVSAEHFEDSIAFRAALRRERLAARAALASDTGAHAALSARIEQHLSQWFASQRPASFAFCAPIRGEFDATPLASRLCAQGWQATMAVADRPATALTFRAWTPDAPMMLDRHGIPVPQTAEVAAPAILLIPLVAFDAQGYRLGFGGGYFDRTLAALVPRPLAVGIGFELARVASICPQPHDQAMDLVVSESGLQAVAPTA